MTSLNSQPPFSLISHLLHIISVYCSNLLKPVGSRNFYINMCVHSYCDVKVENRGCQDLKQGNLSKQL